MTYCLNPDCSQPDNPDSNQYCHGCGSSLAQSSQSYKFCIRYQIVKLLGQGRFGRTYLAKDLHFYEQPRVIKKLIAPYYGQALEQVKELFAREAQQLQKGLFTPNVLEFNYNLETELIQLQKELIERTYRPGNYRTFYIQEPKTRSQAS
jgi:serine/threonine protein kinase